MIVLITGASHTGKTALSQKLLERYKFPCLSIDHLKMGLIRSGNTELSPLSDDADLTEYLWKIVREMIKTAVENKQNFIVEGCYIPFDWQKDFTREYLENIRCFCLVMWNCDFIDLLASGTKYPPPDDTRGETGSSVTLVSESYIRNHFADIRKYADVIDNRLDDGYCTMESVLRDNARFLALARQHGQNYVLIDDEYRVDIDLEGDIIGQSGKH